MSLADEDPRTWLERNQAIENEMAQWKPVRTHETTAPVVPLELPAVGRVVLIRCKETRPGIGFEWQVAFRREDRFGFARPWFWENHCTRIDQDEVMEWRPLPTELRIHK